MFLLGDRGRVARLCSLLAIALVLALLLMTAGCASIVEVSKDKKQATLAAKPGSYTFSIVAQAGSVQRSIPANLNIE